MRGGEILGGGMKEGMKGEGKGLVPRADCCPQQVIASVLLPAQGRALPAALRHFLSQSQQQ